MNVVADACVAVKWYVQEPGCQQAGLLLDARADLIDLCSPDIFLAETLNASANKVRTREASEQQARHAIDHMRFLAVPQRPTLPIMDRAVQLALALDHAVQDCLYLACAEHLSAAFVTADEHFLRKLQGLESPTPIVRLLDVASFLETIGSFPA